MQWLGMSRRAPFGAPLSARTWILALLDGTSAVVLAGMTAAPLNRAAPTHLYAVCGAVLAVITVVLLTVGERLGSRGLLALAAVRIAVVAATLGAATSGGGGLFGGVGLVWVALWVTGFYPMRTVTWTFLGEIAAVVVAVALNPEPLRTALDALPMLSCAVVLSIMLSQAVGSLRHEARHDELTGLMNRRGLDQAMRQLATSRRFAASRHSLVAMDLDGLKLVNDHAGHQAGDQMLITFATELQTAARGVDLTARVGGDEFIAILPGLSAEEAVAWAERLHAISGVAWSYGVAERGSGEELEAWLHRADTLMYAAKTATRATRVKPAAALA